MTVLRRWLWAAAAAVALLSVPGPPAGAQTRRPMTLVDIAELQRLLAPRLSPDGRTLAFLSARDEGKTQIWLLNRAGGEAQRLTNTPQDVQDFTWSPDSQRVCLVLRDASPEERTQIMKKMTAESTKMVKEVLKPEQFTRLQQISWQANVLGTLSNDEEIQKKLNITAEQKDKFKTLNEDMMKDMREIFQDAQGNPQGARTKMEALRKETTNKATEALTEDQKKQWKEMVGKPFEVKMERPRRDT